MDDMTHARRLVAALPVTVAGVSGLRTLWANETRCGLPLPAERVVQEVYSDVSVTCPECLERSK